MIIALVAQHLDVGPTTLRRFLDEYQKVTHEKLPNELTPWHIIIIDLLPRSQLSIAKYSTLVHESSRMC